MKNKILAAVLVVGTLATASFAYNQNCPNYGQRGMMQRQGMPQQGMMQGQGMRQKGMMQRGMHRFGGMQMFSNLNLTNDQKFKMSILRDEMKLEMKKLRGVRGQGKMMNFIGDAGFDKAAFTKYSNDKHQKMMNIRINHMEKVFKILTKEQVAQLKNNINK
ncbi:Spy/CpxP family protein refolding chaperone [Sulfurospirillum arcachonense]|uniref:Spy/CpxP family protein refolding chaperone n=1 Tax=Sulfurospirillum arcachonense TaxID=57666 RepID=UPI00046A90A9|nr:Spy/CpxP family protein refolding chaperone [Sulfurospirillum arcachonense]